jgi:hypothetical protein
MGQVSKRNFGKNSNIAYVLKILSKNNMAYIKKQSE